MKAGRWNSNESVQHRACQHSWYSCGPVPTWFSRHNPLVCGFLFCSPGWSVCISVNCLQLYSPHKGNSFVTKEFYSHLEALNSYGFGYYCHSYYCHGYCCHIYCCHSYYCHGCLTKDTERPSMLLDTVHKCDGNLQPSWKSNLARQVFQPPRCTVISSTRWTERVAGLANGAHNWRGTCLSPKSHLLKLTTLSLPVASGKAHGDASDRFWGASWAAEPRVGQSHGCVFV